MDQLLNVEALAKALGLSTHTIYQRRYRRDDLPPAIRIGSALRWRRADVEAWLISRTEPATQDTDNAQAS